MQGLTCTKQALVRFPSRAKELCLTSGMVSCNGGDGGGDGVRIRPFHSGWGGPKGCPPPRPPPMSPIHLHAWHPALGGGGMMAVHYEATALPFRVGGGLKGVPPLPLTPSPMRIRPFHSRWGGSQGLPPPPSPLPNSPACMAPCTGWGGEMMAVHYEDTDLPFRVGGSQRLPPPHSPPLNVPSSPACMAPCIGGG